MRNTGHIAGDEVAQLRSGYTQMRYCFAGEEFDAALANLLETIGIVESRQGSGNYITRHFDKTLERVLYKRAYLKSGAYLVIEPTEALTTVDVNSGKAIKGKVTEDAIYEINCEAARELMLQLRLRNLSGVLIVDFINMKDQAHKVELMHLLTELSKRDSVPVNVVDMTKLGLVEITRKKIHPPLHEMIS